MRQPSSPWSGRTVCACFQRTPTSTRYLNQRSSRYWIKRRLIKKYQATLSSILSNNYSTDRWAGTTQGRQNFFFFKQDSRVLCTRISCAGRGGNSLRTNRKSVRGLLAQSTDIYIYTVCPAPPECRHANTGADNSKQIIGTLAMRSHVLIKQIICILTMRMPRHEKKDKLTVKFYV